MCILQDMENWMYFTLINCLGKIYKRFPQGEICKKRPLKNKWMIQIDEA